MLPTWTPRPLTLLAVLAAFGAGQYSNAQHYHPQPTVTHPAVPCPPGKATLPNCPPPPWAPPAIQPGEIAPPPAPAAEGEQPPADEPSTDQPSQDQPQADQPQADQAQADQAQQPLTPDFAGAQAPAGTASSEFAAGGSFAPNMIGDLLGGTQNIRIFYNIPGDTPGVPLDRSTIEGGGIVTFRNSKVAENNSPIPRNRLSFRYNYFANAQDITGFTTDDPLEFQPAPGILEIPLGIELDPPNLANPFAFSPPDGTLAASEFQFRTVTRSYDVNLYTFAAEATFLENNASVELRVPFLNGLSPDLDLAAGEVSGLRSDDRAFFANATPERTFGRSDTEFGNMQVILKALLHRDRNFGVTAGLGIGIPTAPSTNVRVADFAQGIAIITDPSGPDGEALPGARVIAFGSDFGLNEVRTQRYFVDNEAWSLSPFLAAVGQRDRLFYQGFLQVELPLNQNSFEYRRDTVDVLGPETFYEERGELQEQTLLHASIGAGYWLYRDPCARWLNGIAGLVELHYTTTLNDADVFTAEDPRFASNLNSAQSLATGIATFETEQAQIGNTANRIDFLNATVGTTFLVGDRLTVTTAVGLPLRNDFDKTFDWEGQVQVNYYFGSLGQGPFPFVPSF